MKIFLLFTFFIRAVCHSPVSVKSSKRAACVVFLHRMYLSPRLLLFLVSFILLTLILLSQFRPVLSLLVIQGLLVLLSPFHHVLLNLLTYLQLISNSGFILDSSTCSVPVVLQEISVVWSSYASLPSQSSSRLFFGYIYNTRWNCFLCQHIQLGYHENK